MKQHPILIAVTLITTLFCGSILCTCVTADNPDDKTFGNGRFLRRLRDDVIGRTKQDPKKKAATKTPANSDNRNQGAEPTPANPKSREVPTPAARPSSAVTSRNKLLSAFDKSADQPSAAKSPALASQPLKTDPKNSRVGFGMQIDSKNDALTVVKTDSRGNASEAGIRKGDVIVAAGGVEIKSIEELNEITSILGNGDQLEFEISRRGQKKKVLIQFGDAPEEADVIVSKKETPAKKVSNFNFVPEPDESNSGAMHSVLNDPPSVWPNSNPVEANRIPQTGSQIDSAKRLNATSVVEQQRLQIEKLKREIERLRQQSESNLNSQSSNWNSPSLSGPEK